jgi:cyclic pyranopterin phosphate synthase
LEPCATTNRICEEDRDARYVNNSAMTPERVRWVLETHRGAEEVCFTSGEPTTRLELPQFLVWARELGYRRISMMTNGRRMGHPPYAAALVKRGLNRVYISVHGHEKRLHEGLTRTPGSFEQTLAGIDTVARLKARGVELHTSTVVTLRNLPHLADVSLPPPHGVDQVVFNDAGQRPCGYLFRSAVPRYTEIARVFREFSDEIEEDRPMAFLVDIPLCTTEGIADFNRGYVEKYRHFDLESQVSLPLNPVGRRGEGAGKGLMLVLRSDLDDDQREKRDECKSCKYFDHCEGVWKNYLSRYGWDELVPVRLEPKLPDARASAEPVEAPA